MSGTALAGGLDLAAARLQGRSQLLARRRRRGARHPVLQEPQPRSTARRDVREQPAVLDGERPRAARTCAATCSSSSAATASSAAQAEYHFPLFSIGSLDFRALAFYDVAGDLVPQPAPEGIGRIHHRATRPTSAPSCRRHQRLPAGLRPQARHPPRRGRRPPVLPALDRGAAVGFDAGYGLEVAELALHADCRGLGAAGS